MDIINKIETVIIKDFKGYYEKHVFCDTSGDIVLLIGPNGYGKTSFIEALTLALSGHFEVKSGGKKFEPDMITPVLKKNSNPEITINEYKLDKCKENKHKGEESKIVWNLGDKVKKEKGKYSIKSGFHGSGKGEYFGKSFWHDENLTELNSRLSSFFQDKMDLLFDEAVSGKTVLDVVSPRSKGLKKLKEELEKAKKNLQDEEKKYYPYILYKSKEEVNNELEKKSELFLNEYNFFAEKSGLGWPVKKPFFISGTETFKFLKDALGLNINRIIKFDDLVDMFRASLYKDLSKWTNKLKNNAGESTKKGKEIKKEIGILKNEIEDIDRKFPNLENEVNLFEPESVGNPDALKVIESIIENFEKWKNIDFSKKEDNETKNLRIITEEFNKVNVSKAIACKSSLESWILDRKKTLNIRDEKKRNLEKLKRDFDKYKKSVELDKAESIVKNIDKTIGKFLNSFEEAFTMELEIEKEPSRKKIRKLITNYIDAFQIVLDRMNTNNYDSSDKFKQDTISKLESGVNFVAKRFSFVEGVFPIKVNRESRGAENDEDFSKIKAEDNRGLEHFSTGQKAQLGISSLIAQNSLLSNFLNHKIIMLDDMTTSYDLSNLTRESILWRQLAYGLKSDDSLKRQIFISTHHEDLTNNLIELLAPPHGGELRLIKFEGWKRNKGPIFKEFRVEPCNKIEKENLENFAEDLRNIFK